LPKVFGDPRHQAELVIGDSDRFADFLLGNANFCGGPMTAGPDQPCDRPDLLGLPAPRPLRVVIGVRDLGLQIAAAMSRRREVGMIDAAWPTNPPSLFAEALA
jgi:hypothetical protein